MTNNGLGLVELFQRMSELTEPECSNCKVPYSCCASEYCSMAKEWTKQVYQIDLADREIEGNEIPFLSQTGCVLEPHFRPSCTLHTCEINAIGCKVSDSEWTDRYFKLREEIELEVNFN